MSDWKIDWKERHASELRRVFEAASIARQWSEKTDEAFYVVSGTFSVKVGEQLKEVGPGSFVFAPRGVPHVYVNTGKTEGTLLTVASPTKWEAYMREATDALRHMPPGQLDQKILNAISDKYKVRIVGPPLGSGVQLELPRKP